MKVELIKNSFGSLTPCNDSDLEVIKRIKEGQRVVVNIEFDRNLRFNKKFQALVNLAFENQDSNLSIESYKDLLIIRSGFFFLIPSGCGIQIVPESTSFDSMDQMRFEKVYDSVLRTIQNDLKINDKDIELNLDRYY